MSRTLLIVAALWAATLEWSAWGARSGPGWLLLWAVALLGSSWIARRCERPAPLWSRCLWAFSFMFAAAPCLLDSEVVHVFAPPLAALTLAIATFARVSAAPHISDLTRFTPVTASGMQLAWTATRDGIGRPGSPSAWRGLALSLPLLVVFGALLLAADPEWGSAMSRWFEGWPDFTGSLIRGALWTMLALTLLGSALPGAARRPEEQGGAFDPVSVGIALNLVSVMFGLFLAFQKRYLFAAVAPGALTLANYARHGFFELFTCCLLVLLLTTVVHHATFLHPDPHPARRGALLLNVLSGGLLASSLHRMLLYVNCFGLTVTRAYVLLTLSGIAAALGLCIYALARGRRPDWLVSRGVLLFLGTLACVSLINVEARVAAVNVGRSEVDYVYLKSLSCDAVTGLNPGDPAQLKVILAIQGQTPQAGDWRSWNLSRAHALRVDWGR